MQNANPLTPQETQGWMAALEQASAELLVDHAPAGKIDAVAGVFTAVAVLDLDPTRGALRNFDTVLKRLGDVAKDKKDNWGAGDDAVESISTIGARYNPEAALQTLQDVAQHATNQNVRLRAVEHATELITMNPALATWENVMPFQKLRIEESKAERLLQKFGVVVSREGEFNRCLGKMASQMSDLFVDGFKAPGPQQQTL